jgi:hypothetical protein
MLDTHIITIDVRAVDLHGNMSFITTRAQICDMGQKCVRYYLLI